MTGPEHYAEAERLLGYVENSGPDPAGELIAAAQVHAVLALTAAYAADAIYRRDDRAAWDAATGQPAGTEVPHP